MPEFNRFCWNTNVGDSAECNGEHHQSEASMVFCDMLCDGHVKPNRFPFPSVVKACERASRLSEGKQVHGSIVKFGFDGDEFVISHLVRMELDMMRQDRSVVLWIMMFDGHVRLGDLKNAKSLFDEMAQRSEVSWNVMISGYAQNGHSMEAVNVFEEKQTSNLAPIYATLVSILPAISRIGALELGKWIHLYARKNKIEMDDELRSALMYIYFNQGCVDNGLQVFKRLPWCYESFAWCLQNAQEHRSLMELTLHNR